MRFIWWSLLATVTCFIAYVCMNFAVFLEANRLRDKASTCLPEDSFHCWIAPYLPEVYAYSGVILAVFGLCILVGLGIFITTRLVRFVARFVERRR